MDINQQTISKSIAISGIGLHSGSEVTMSIMPGQVDTGIVFVRSDVTGKDNVIPARWDYVSDTRLCTVISNQDNVCVGTIEHLMAAFRGFGVDNAVVRLDGPEVPVMDGSAAPFMAALEKTGLKAQNKARRVIKILKEIKAEEDGKFASLAPSITSQFRGTIDFEHSAIGKQSHNIHMINGNFAHELSNCRTFGFLDDVQALRKAGLALGGSLDNAIVLDHDKVMNKDGLRRPDEFIRHKLLDAVGDLFLAGATIIGAYDCYKPSHALNNALLHRMFADKSAWTYVSMDLGAVEPHATQKARMHDIVSAL